MSIFFSATELRQLKKIFREERIRQEDIALEVGVSQEQLCRILNGHAGIRSAAARKLREKYAHKLPSNSSALKCQDDIVRAALELWDGEIASAETLVSFLHSARVFRGG